MIALHAALLAGKAGRPVRMIYDRHEDLAATTKRHPAIVRHRTGVTRDGRLLAQDIEVVMDGGAYCTLTPVVLSRGAIHAGGPYRCPNVRIRARATRTNTPPNGAFRGFGAPQTEFAAETHLNRIAEALGLSPLEIRRRNVYRARRHDPDRPGPARRASPARRSSSGPPRPASSSACAPATRPHGPGGRAPATVPGSPLRTGPRPAGRGRRPGARLARRRVHRVRRGQARVGRLARADRRRPHRHPGRLDRDGPGHQDDLPAAGRRRPRRAVRGGRDRAAGHGVRPGFGADRRVADGDGRRRAADPGGAAGCAHRSRRRPAAPSRRPTATTPARRARSGSTSASSRIRASASTTRPTAATPTRRSAGRPAWRRSRSISTPARSTSATWSPSTTSGAVIHPVLAEGQVEGGTLQAVGYATIEEIKLRDGRYLNDRLATYIIPTALDAPRITTILVEAPFDGVPHGAKGVGRAADGRRRPGRRRGHRGCDRRLDPRPAGQPGAGPGGAGRASPRSAPLPPGASEPARPAAAS